MTKLQFRVLYRQFLFRMVDLELLSAHAQGDVTKLFGQFAALLSTISLFILSFLAMGVSHRGMPHRTALVHAWGLEHIVIATTMLVVGLFAVLSWDSTFPDRRDVMVLAPLPVSTRTLFLAKVAALGTALSLTVISVNAFSGLIWPVALADTDGGVFLSAVNLIRSFVAYWLTMFAAGAFIFCSVLAVQGLAAYVLPRSKFLRLSAVLQFAAFCLFVSVYFLQPSLATPAALTAARNQHLLMWLPSYWFLGLLQLLNGSMHAAVIPLAHKAVTGLSAVVCLSSGIFVLSYLRTLRKIVEEPDIVPGARGAIWLPQLGTQLQTAIVLFSIHTLLRSRQHRVMLCFYLGIAFAVVIGLLKTPILQKQLFVGTVNANLIAASIIVLLFWIAGIRIVFSLPFDLRANWVFRITPICGGAGSYTATRRALLALSFAPVLTVSAMVFLSLWPFWEAAGHIVLLGLLGTSVTDLCLYGFQKIPFTCSYLPGKSNAHMAFWGFIAVIFPLTAKAAEVEVRALQNLRSYAWALFVLVIAAAAARWRTVSSTGAELQFEDVPLGDILLLGLHRDGVTPIPSQGIADPTAA